LGGPATAARGVSDHNASPTRPEAEEAVVPRPIGGKYPRVAAQQAWVDGDQTAVLEILAKFDFVMASLEPGQIATLRRSNPYVILLPFDSLIWYSGWPEAANYDFDSVVRTYLGYQGLGYDGVYADHWDHLTEQSLTELGRRLRAGWPEGFFVGNAARPLEHSYALNGFMFEDYPTYGKNFDDEVIGGYRNWVAQASVPHLLIMNQRALGTEGVDKPNRRADFWERMRYATTISMLFDSMYVMYNYGGGGSPHWASPWWFDEYSVDIGQPLGEFYALPMGVYARRFSGGIVLVNTTAEPKTVSAGDLDQTYYRFLGGQRPDWNNGQPFDSVTLDGWSKNGQTGEWAKPIGDGIILVASPQTIVSDILVDDSECRLNNIQGAFTEQGMTVFVQSDKEGHCDNEFSPFADDWRIFPREAAHFAPPGDGSRYARFSPNVGLPGDYEVFLWYPNQIHERFIELGGFALNQVASDAKVRIEHAGGTTVVTIDMRQNGGEWVSLGTYPFAPGNGYVEIRNDANGYVFADAVKFVWRGEGSGSTFADVPQSHWAYADIEKLYQGGYVAGCQATPVRKFCPEAPLTRAEAAVFVERGVHGGGFLPPEPGSSVFSDVALGTWYAKWVHQLWLDGFTSGCATGPLRFCPHVPHSRAEATVFFLRMLRGKDYVPPEPSSLPYSDVARGAWYFKWVAAAYDAGLTQDCEDPSQRGDDRFRPEEPITRAEAACMMARAKGLSLP